MKIRCIYKFLGTKHVLNGILEVKAKLEEIYGGNYQIESSSEDEEELTAKVKKLCNTFNAFLEEVEYASTK